MATENDRPSEEGSPPDTPAKADVPGPSAADSASQAFHGVRERLGLEQSGIFMGAVVLAAVAFLAATIGLIIYTTADGGDAEFDGQVIMQLGLGAAIGSTALFVLARHQSGPRTSGDDGGRDLRVAYALGGLIAVWSLLGLFKAFDESWSGQDGWFAYARVYAFFFVAWLVVAKPVPKVIGTMPAVTIGLAELGVAGALLLLGMFMGMSDDFSTWVNGVAFQNLGIVLAITSLGWFLGLQPERS